MLVNNHKYVESYWVEELPNGVIHLLINCKQREIHYHSYNDNEFLICGTEEEYDNSYDNLHLVLIVNEFLPKNNNFIYIQTSIHEKEQLSFYYIPYDRDWIKNKKFIIK